MPHQRLQYRHRISQTGCLDDNALQGIDFARLHPFNQIRQRIHQLTANGAAEATICKLDNPVSRLLNKQMIYTDITKFIDDNRRILQGRIFQQPVE